MKSGEDEADIRDLTEKEVSKRRVVMKRIKTDNLGVRKNFLTSGTMAQGTEETGIAEAFMFQRIKRNPLVSPGERLKLLCATSTKNGINPTDWIE